MTSLMSVDQSKCANRIRNQSDLTCVRKREASKLGHQVLGFYPMGVLNDPRIYWLIKMAPIDVPWLVPKCVINRKNAVRKTKTWNGYNSVNFYSNWKIDPSKLNISASPVEWSGSDITKKWIFGTKKWENWTVENIFLAILDFENSLFWALV